MECSLRNLADRTVMLYRTVLKQFRAYIVQRELDIDPCTKQVVRKFTRPQLFSKKPLTQFTAAAIFEPVWDNARPRPP